MRTTAPLDALRDLLSMANVGLATKQDLTRLERRLDELDELVDALAAKLAEQRSKCSATIDPAAPRP